MRAADGDAARGAGSGLARLVLTDFRSYARVELAPDPRPLVFVGPNGAGKTNLLEAVSLLAPGRGLRQAGLADLARAEPGEVAAPRAWAVAARLRDASGETEIGTGRAPPAAPGAVERRLVHINGVARAGQGELAELVRLSWLTPAMDRLFQEGAGGRRRFLDRLALIFDPAHATRVAAYERAMRERLRLLRQGVVDPAWLTGLERQMAETGIAIAVARAECLAHLAAGMEAGDPAFPAADLHLEGEVDATLRQGATAVAAEDALQAALAAGRRRDAEAGRTGAGPHASDLCVTHRLKGRAAGQCSTGEQKALLIAIVLAAARVQRRRDGAAPLLLLDEVAAHLDVLRRAALFDAICALGAQAWLTGTDAALFSAFGDRAQGFAVTAGRVLPLDLGRAR